LQDINKVEKLVAKKIHDARSQKGLTLAQLSERTGISISMLSKIENAKVSSPVSTYAKISKALEFPMGKLFSEDGAVPISLVKKEERKRYTRSRAYIGESIAYKKSNKKMEPFIHVYPPGFSNPALYQHDNEELIFVIEGTLEFRYGETTYILTPGDCVYFDADIEHTARALGDKTARALVVEA